MHYCNTLISTLLPVLTIFSDPIASESSSASSSSEEQEELVGQWKNPFDDLISSTSDNLFKRWEDTQVSIYLEPNSKG